MTRLRKMMLEELERRNYSEATTRCYIRTVEDFSRRFKRSPDCLGPEHIREYQAELFKKHKLSPGTVTQRLAALRFFYIKTLKKTWSIAETPYPKRAFHLPSILSREEVAQLIDAALTPYHRTLLMTLYATGGRPMLESYFKLDHTLRRLRAEPTGRYMDDFAKTLHTKGYGVWAAQAYLRAAAHLGIWMKQQGLSVMKLDDQVIGEFARHLP